MMPDQTRDDRNRRKDAATRGEREAGALGQLDIFARRTIARMFQLRRRADQPPAQEKVDARLEVREVRHRDEQLAARCEHAEQLAERARLVLEREMFEHVEAQRAIEGSVGKRQARHRRVCDALGLVVDVNARDRETRRVLVDEHALPAAGVEDARSGGQRVEVSTHRLELREIRRVVLPGRIGRTVIVPARRVFAAAHPLRVARHS